jgi:hypothetical protein
MVGNLGLEGFISFRLTNFVSNNRLEIVFAFQSLIVI